MYGLGYGLIEKDGKVFYNCNYLGYPFEYEAPLIEIEEIDVEYDDYDDDGKIIGVIKKKKWVMKDFDKDTGEYPCAAKIKVYFDKNIAGSKGMQDWFRTIYNKTAEEVEFYETEEDLKVAYDKIDFEQKDATGDNKIISDCINKEVKYCIDNSIMVVI